jgi:hypothetical protein
MTDDTDTRGIRIGGDTATVDHDPGALLEVARDELPGDWTIDEGEYATLRLVGTGDAGWVIYIDLNGSTWVANAYADGEETATIEMTFAASWQATEPERLRKVCELERGRIRKVFDGASDEATALLKAIEGVDSV